jgi:protein phosphatase 1D
MPSGKGVTISVTAETDAGKRRHMEDYLDVRLAPSNEALRNTPGLKEQAFVGVFDGHGGKEAALYARERLWDLIQEQSKFRTTDRQKVAEAIKDAYLGLHREMEPMRPRWKPNKLGDQSTAGTTACTVIFRQDHFYVANVGDSGAVLATVNQRAGEEGQPPVIATMLSKDHKPEDPVETKRVESLGGQVKISRKGVPRVVWERKKTSDDPDKPPTVDLIPFLSVSRSLGDFWSWCERTQKFVVSPHPDVDIHPLDPTCQKFLVLASDGLWNVMSPQDAVNFIWEYKTTPADEKDEKVSTSRDVVRALIDEALYRWRKKGMFADNISVVIAFLTQEGTEDRALQSLLRCQDSKAKTRPEREEESQQRVEERLPFKRSREETEGETISLTRPPLQKKSRQERDSGCESDSGSPVAESEGSLIPEGPSSGTSPQTVEPCSSSPILVSSPPLPA